MWLVLGGAFAGLQYRLWSGDGSIPAGFAMQERIAAQRNENEKLFQRNAVYVADLEELKSGGMESVEERARSSLGMVKSGETLFIIPFEQN